MTAFPRSPMQMVSLVSKGGTPVTLVDQFGTPYPTTGWGALVFQQSPELFNPIIHDATFTGGGVVTSLRAGVGMSVGVTNPATGNVVIDLANTSVLPGTYGANNLVPVITIDAQGRITAAGGVVPSAGLEVGVSAIASGTAGYVLYNANGTLGEYAVATDTANALLRDAPADGNNYARKDNTWVNLGSSTGYLPITGGTLTGPLTGTSITISGSLSDTGTMPLQVPAGQAIQFVFGGTVGMQANATEIFPNPTNVVSLGSTGARWAKVWATQLDVSGASNFAVSPTIPTSAPGTSSTAAASTAFVAAAISSLGTVYQPLDADLTALAALSTTGVMARTAANTFATRTLTGTANRITITNGDGVAGAPTFNIAAAYDALWQPIDATLTALAALNATTGLLEQTAADTFTKRAIGVAAATDIPSRADADTRYVQLTNFNELSDDRVAAFLVAGANITLTYDDPAGTLTIASSGGGGGGGTVTTMSVVSANGFAGFVANPTTTPAITLTTTVAAGMLKSSGTALQAAVAGTDYVAPAALAAYAPLASPLFTGDPRVPTPGIADADTSIANTSWVSSHVTNRLGGYLPLTGGGLSGGLTGTTATFSGLLESMAAAIYGPLTVRYPGSDNGIVVNQPEPAQPTRSFIQLQKNSFPALQISTEGDSGFIGQNYYEASSPGGAAATHQFFADGISVLTMDKTSVRFPLTIAPSDNSTQVATTAWVKANAGGGGSTVTISTTPPASPTVGSQWWQSELGQMFIYYQDPGGAPAQWVPASAPVGSTTVPRITVSATAPSAPAINDLWVDTT